MSTNQPDSAIIHQDNVTSTPAVPVTKTQPEGTRKGGGRRVMTVRHSVGKRVAESVRKFKEKRVAKSAPKFKTSPVPPIIHPTSGRVVRRNSMTRENPPTITTPISTIPASVPINLSHGRKKIKGGGRSGQTTVRHSTGKRKSQSPPTHPYTDSYGVTYRSREEAELNLTHPYNGESYVCRHENREQEENRIVGELNSNYSMDNFFSEDEVTAGCKWDYSLLLSDLPSSNIDDDDGNKNTKTDKK